MNDIKLRIARTSDTAGHFECFKMAFCKKP